MNLTRFAWLLAFGAAAFGASATTESFPIGTTWPDSDGVHINCHGGCVVPYEGAYYWFGESRTGGHSDGISVYRSTDLYNWDNMGYAVTHGGERDDVNLQDISEGRLLERPKVIYNAATGKWVMWAHWENGNDYGQARVAVLQADKITGPYTFISTFRPNDHDSRDMTLFLDTDGKAYHFCSTNMNTDINVVRLSDDFLTPSKDEIMIMKGARLEATTVCKVDEMYFATFSECNGWDPAPGHSATAIGDMLGQWTEGLNFCTDADASRSYRSQGAYVFSVEGLGYDPKCFIFYGDRWNSSNVGGSTYVWLPLSVRSGYPVVRNYATWNLDEVMSTMYRYKRAATITDGAEMSLLERRSDRLVSRLGRQAGLCIKNDDDRVNIRFEFKATADPHVWMLRDADTGLYLCEYRGKLRFQEADGEKNCMWRFVLEPDGYYNVINQESGNCLMVEANSRLDGAALVPGVLGQNDAQGFAPYFDSDLHPDYAEAPIFTRAYYAEVAEKIKEQAYEHNFPGIESLPFAAGKAFAVMHTVSGRALTFADNKGITVSDFRQLDSQRITFVAAPAGAEAKGYNVTDGRGNYMVKSGTYSTVWTDEADLTAATSIFVPEEGDGRFYIKCADGSNRYLGTDDSTDGASVYSDKQIANRNLSYWYLADFENSVTVSPEDLFIEKLDALDIFFGSIDPAWCGTDPFDYDASAYAALERALDEAMAVKSDFESASEAIEKALEEFEATKTVLPDADRKYNIIHMSGLRLAMTDDESPVIAETADADADSFVFTSNGDNTFLITNAATGKHLSNKTGSNWSMAWADEGADNRTRWKVSVNSLGNKAFYNMYIKGYMGSDDIAGGSPLYCNKGVDETFAQWSIKEAGASSVTSVATEAAYAVNAVLGGVRISAHKATAAVYDLSGKCVAQMAVDGSATVALAAGIYIVRVSGDAGTVTVKAAVR